MFFCCFQNVLKHIGINILKKKFFANQSFLYEKAKNRYFIRLLYFLFSLTITSQVDLSKWFLSHSMFSTMYLLRGEVSFAKITVYYSGCVLKAIFVRSSRAFSGDKVLYHCQPVFCVAKCNVLHWVSGLTAKLYISPIKFAYLSSSRLCMSVLLSLTSKCSSW